jgi:hypothetical protein
MSILEGRLNESPDRSLLKGTKLPLYRLPYTKHPKAYGILCNKTPQPAVPTMSRMAPVLQDYRVNNLPTIDAPPSKKVFAITIKFFIDHYSIAPITSHVDLLGFIPHPSSPVRL